MNSDKTLWFAVLQTFLIDASEIGKVVNKQNKEFQWDILWHEASQPSTKAICELLDINFRFFLERIEYCYRNGYKMLDLDKEDICDIRSD